MLFVKGELLNLENWSFADLGNLLMSSRSGGEGGGFSIENVKVELLQILRPEELLLEVKLKH